MKLTTYPLHRDIFPNESSTSIEELLANVPSEIVIKLFCGINTKLKFQSNTVHEQLSILKPFLERQGGNVVKGILYRIDLFYQRNPVDEILIFTSQFSLELIHYEILNFRAIRFTEDDITPEMELRILKAYFLFIQIKADEKTERHFQSVNTYNNRSDYFRKNVWPTFFDQIESQTRPETYSITLRGIALIEFLLKHPKYESCAKAYLELHKIMSGWEYMMKIMHLVQVGLSHKNAAKDIPFSAILDSTEFHSLLESFVLDIRDYQANFEKSSLNFGGLKSKPLIKFEQSTIYHVIEWHFLLGKLYDGLFFDLYHSSGINAFQKLPDFKNFIALEVSEKILFQKTCKGLFFEKKPILHFFDDRKDKGFPDAYYRKGNKIILFEFKDAFMSGVAIDSQSYENISAEIDKKYNTDSKGTGQIINYIKNIDSIAFKDDGFSEMRRKESLIIYPAIIYTDKFFGVEGVGDYLADEFDAKLKASNLENDRIKIKRLNCFDFNKMMIYFLKVSQEKISLITLMNNYIDRIEKRKKRLPEQSEVEFLSRTQNSIETEFLDSIVKDAMRTPGYLEKMVRHFELPIK